MLKLTAKAIKTTLIVDQAQLYGAVVPPGMLRVSVEIAVGSRRVRADLNAKSLRRVIAAVEDGEVTVIVQGKLEAGDILAEAGISAVSRVKTE